MKRVLLIFTLAVTMMACDRTEKPVQTRIAKGNVVLGGILRTTELGPPLGLKPDELASVAGYRIGNQIHSGLLRLDPITLKPIPAIAERVDPDTSGTSYIIHLRQGVRFQPHPCLLSTGGEVTAHDVAFSFKMLCRPNSLAYETTFKGRVRGAERFHGSATDEIPGIRVLDDYTLQIELTRPDESFLYLLAQPTTGIISQKAYEECDLAVVGAGPFCPVVTEPDLLLVRHPEYFASDEFGNHLPYLDSVTVTFISSKELALERLLLGDLDIVTGVYLDPVKSLLDRHASLFTGADARFVMQRNDEVASYEVFAIHTSRLRGFRENFLGHRDYAVLQMSR